MRRDPVRSEPRLVVSIGCPSGIGPEVSVVAAAGAKANVLLVGDVAVVERAALARGLAREVRRVAEPDEAFGPRRRGVLYVWQPTETLASRDRTPGSPTKAGGAAQLAWIDAACDLVFAKGADALITGPVSKEAIVRSGARGAARFLGHTEHLARRLLVPHVVMAFWTERLTTALVTTHLPLSKVPRAIDAKGVTRATVLLCRFLLRLSRDRRRALRVAVASLNPHAGEGGLLGHEEATVLAPGIRAARRVVASSRCAIAGPVPAETAFRRAASGAYEGVVAMYHDQATIPMKLLAFGDAVNVTLGLPIVRTSVDHGTGYDIAGRGIADAAGMVAALALAGRLVGNS
ncbi:MAG: 4-hydroxythreonine-4-phosphate dehydrogenase PdxA [Myxococcales bacterium]|nr:4-hydroxythreonine-4-phosphate dehydrogenase PdxA [Myxococcales bacterium]